MFLFWEQLLSVLAFFSFFGFIPAIAKTRQEVYYTYEDSWLSSEGDYSDTFIAMMDGVIRDVTLYIECQASFTAGTELLFSYTLRSQLAQMQFGGDVSDWTTWGAMDVDGGVLMHTMSMDMAPRFVMGPTVQGQSIAQKERRAMNVSKGDTIHYQRRLDGSQEETPLTTGAYDVWIQVKQVVAPYRYIYDNVSVAPMRTIMMFNLSNKFSKQFHTNLPCMGYHTNISFSMLGAVAGDGANTPLHFYFGADIDSESFGPLNSTFTGWKINELLGKPNVIYHSVGRTESLGANAPEYRYTHFGKRYISYSRNDMFTFIFNGNAAIPIGSMTVLLEADFVPMYNADFAQEIQDDFSIDDYDEFYLAPVKLRDVVLTISAIVTAGSAFVDLLLLPSHIKNVVNTANAEGDILDTSPESGRLTNAMNRITSIPLSVNQGASNLMIPIGKMDYNDKLAFDLKNNTSLAGNVVYHIRGKVDKRYYSKGNKFLMSDFVYDYSQKHGRWVSL